MLGLLIKFLNRTEVGSEARAREKERKQNREIDHIEKNLIDE